MPAFTQDKCQTVRLIQLKAEIDDYYQSFLTLDVLTGLMSVLVVVDLSTLIFSFFTKFMGWHVVLNKVVISLNYVLIGLIGFFGFWRLEWDFSHWKRYIDYGACFSYTQMDSWLQNNMGREMSGSKYIGIVRWVTIGLFLILTGFYLYGMTRKDRAAYRQARYRATRQQGDDARHEQDGPADREHELQNRSVDPNTSDMMALKPDESRIR